MSLRKTFVLAAALIGLMAGDLRAEEGTSPFRSFGRRPRTTAARRYYNPFRVVVRTRFLSNPFGLPVPAIEPAATTVSEQPAAAPAPTVAATDVAAAEPVVTSEAPTFGSNSSLPQSVIVAPPPYRPPPRSPYRPAPRPPF